MSLERLPALPELAPRWRGGTIEFPLHHMRGGTSTGLVIWERYVPTDRALREELLQLGLLRSRPRIEHVAAWVSNLDRARGFYERWFHAASTPEYSSATRNFRSRFLSLDGGPRLELMVSPKEAPRHHHIAISVGSRPAVDRLIKEMEVAGIRVVSHPRVTGDGYYEAVIEDSEGNLVEITA